MKVVWLVFCEAAWNLWDFLTRGQHEMTPSPNWENLRVKATMTANMRLIDYKIEREARIADYVRTWEGAWRRAKMRVLES